MKRIVLDLEDHAAEALMAMSDFRDHEGRPVLASLRSANYPAVSATVVEEGYLIDNLEEKLRALRDNFAALQKSGFTRTLLEAYVRSKGINKRDFDSVMGAVNDFFWQLK